MSMHEEAEFSVSVCFGLTSFQTVHASYSN